MRRLVRAGHCTVFGIANFLFLAAPGAQAAVGVTPGAPSVSPAGAVGYEVPLTLPPGTNGLTPSLSLRYSHTQDSGLFGVGWSLTGLSAISRCNKTVAQDGAPSAATLAISDGYCLDGNRLRLDTGTYGAAGSIFRTEIETFSRVLVSTANANGPLSWEVRGKDGLIYEYGNTTDSRIEAVGPGIARLWALNKIKDRSGNYIEILYTEDATNGSFRPSKLRYTGNSTLGTTPATDVEFLYETVPVGEVDSGYFAGGLIKRVTRADRIDVKHNGTTLVHRYELTYEVSLSSTSKSRLASIQECAGTTPDCLPATTFSYLNGTSGLGSETNTAQSIPTTPWSIDVNGDGRADLVYSSSTGSGTWMVMFANTSGGYNSPTNTTIPNTNYAGATPIDYNADGLEDLLVPYSGGTWWVMLGTSSGLASPSNTSAPVTTTGSGANARAIDVDGDGLEDLVWADLIGYAGGDAIRYRLRVSGGAFSSTVYTLVAPLPVDQKISYAFGASALSLTHRIPDFNGDGRGDVVYQLTNRTWNDTSYFYTYYFYVACSGSWSSSASTAAASTPYFGDFNGDGMEDIFYYTSAGYFKLRYSRGTSLSSEVTGTSISGYSTAVVIHDWEGDGYDDILAPHISTGLWHLFRSTGEALSYLGSTGIAFAAGTTNSTIADMNGDGLLDLVYAVSGTWRYRPHSGTYPDLLQTATDGFGNAVTFNYAPLTDSSGFYTKGSGSTFPTQEYQGGTWVVSTQVTSNGIGGTYTLTHTYENARLHLQGRGFLGFGQRKVTDSRNSVRSEETYLQNPAEYQAIGAASLVQVKQGSGTLIAETTNTWNKVQYGSGVTERRFPYVSQQVVKRWEAGGTYNGYLLSTATTTNSVDSTSGTVYDSTTATVEAATANGVQASASYSQRVYHPTAYFTNDTSSSWCIGRPGRTELIHSHNQYGGSSITRTVSRTWDSTNCRITQEIVEPDSTQWKVTRDLGYDAWGNVNSDAITGISMSARITTANWGSTGRFLASVTNPLSQATQFGWDATIGTLTSATDPNGIVTSWLYDVFGRKTQENRPDGTDTTVSYNDCTGVSGGCVNSNNKLVVIATQRDTSDSFVSDQWSYLDKFNRPIVTKGLMLSGAYNRVDREYDALGRVYRESAPCWWSGCTQYWTTLTYDLLNRPTQVSRPTSDSDPTPATTISYFEGLTTRILDPLSKQGTKIANVLGGLARSIDHNGYYQNFDVDAFGNTVRVTDSAGNTLQSITYNVRGMKTAASDMDLGSWTFTPNALGEVVSQTDAKSQNATFVFDALGRLTSRTETEGTSTWTWGTSSSLKNIGRLASLSGPGYSEGYTFDSIGRLQQTTINSDASYSVDYAYNAIGQLAMLTYPTSTSSYRLKLQYDYQNGSLLRVKDFNAPTTVFWQANATDPRGAVIDESLGNGLQTLRGLDLVTGLIDSITTGPSGGTSIQNLSYAWDTVGNLTQRQDVRQSLTEAFYYDNLHRLDYSTLNGSTNLDLSYDALGNITSKSDVAGGSAWTYHATKKHAVTAAGSGGPTFAYDANGNVSTRSGSAITWYSYNLPNTLNASGSNSSQFFYTPDRSRWKQVASFSGTAETTIYIGGLIEKVTLGAVTSWKHYISGGSGPVAVYTRKSTGVNEIHYLTRDHLGSVDSVTTGTGAVEVRLSFASFGQRRQEAGWSGNPTSGDWTEITDSTRRGFTFHEMLDNLSLIHMNGRVYDPAVGRFLSADPLVANHLSTQGFNRFAYVRNNPLSLTDPSGFKDKETRVQLKDRDPGTFYELSQNIAFRNQFFAGGSASGDAAGSHTRGFCSMACTANGILQDFRGASGPVFLANSDARLSVTIKEGSQRNGNVTVENPDGSPADMAPREGSGNAGQASRLLEWLIGVNGGAAWSSVFNEPWVHGRTGGRLPMTLAAGLDTVALDLPADASANGMHAWHAGSNAYLAQQLGLVGAPFIFLGGLYHESPLDWGSFQAEQYWQGTVNHVLDSVTDIVANSFGMAVGYAHLINPDAAIPRAIAWGNYVPGPGEPDPTFGGGGPYNGDPTAAWGQYPGGN